MELVPVNPSTRSLADYSFGDVISTVPRMPEPARQALIAKCGDLPAALVGKESRMATLQMVQMSLSDLDGVHIDEINTITDMLRSALVINGFDNPLGSLSLLELLQRLNTRGDEYHAICQALRSDQRVALAIERTDGRVLVTYDGKVDIAETVQYIRHMNSRWWWLWKFMGIDGIDKTLEEMEPTVQIRPQHNEGYYEEMVRAHVGQAAHTVRGHNTTTYDRVCAALSIEGNYNRLRSIFVFDSLKIEGHNNSAVVRCCGHIDFENEGNYNQITFIRVSWYVAAKELGLIWE